MKKMKKILIWAGVLVLLIGSFMFYWNYVNTYSEGNRAGTLQKFSKKGSMFKTYEGELIMNSLTSTGNSTISSEKFFFSVKDEAVAKKMFALQFKHLFCHGFIFFSVKDEAVAKKMFELEGKHITVTYEQKRNHLPWNGDTDYFITNIVSIE